MDPTTTLQAVRQWPVQDRLDFLFGVWDQLVEDGWRPEPTDDLLAELDCRLAAHEANPGNVRTWAQVVEQVKAPRNQVMP
jgi:putative addiction module component (TIGR02574 family)